VSFRIVLRAGGSRGSGGVGRGQVYGRGGCRVAGS
jgi:hypothetical protein